MHLVFVALVLYRLLSFLFSLGMIFVFFLFVWCVEHFLNFNLHRVYIYECNVQFKDSYLAMIQIVSDSSYVCWLFADFVRISLNPLSICFMLVYTFICVQSRYCDILKSFSTKRIILKNAFSQQHSNIQLLFIIDF